MMEHITIYHTLVFTVLLLGLGLYAVIVRRNAIMVLMGLEFMLNAAGINFVAASGFRNTIDGSMYTIFIIVIAAAEAAIALAILLTMYKHFKHIHPEDLRVLKEEQE